MRKPSLLLKQITSYLRVIDAVLNCTPAAIAHVVVADEESATVATVVLHLVGDALAVERAHEVVDVVLVVVDDLCLVDVLDVVTAVVTARIQVTDRVSDPLLSEFKFAFGVHCWLLVCGRLGNTFLCLNKKYFNFL